MIDKLREEPLDEAVGIVTSRDLTIVELEAVSGGCPCRPTPCDCDKPSPRIP